MSEVLPFVRVPAVRPAAAQVAAVWDDDPSPTMERHFRRVHETRMLGLPFLNEALDVAVAACERVGGDWLAAVVTPWSIQLVLLPGGGTLWCDTAAGMRHTLSLPVGNLVFIGEAAEHASDLVPAFQYCPLITPPEGIADTDAACAIAREALATVLKPLAASVADPTGALPSEDADPNPRTPPSPSRRAFLRGRS
ncbi:[NiFe]-hydrogenase assembly chaperone HybE [Aromatoleum petrolei]|uniref:[NiFe]-hydrogenase assembly chaperone HybE n=1 Tax=Aromatoleum petrolei TaxID=76116 RepID=A0ABX1MMK8_9RHOO|nr:[NiFe]-hydrogenase assembly chaperone HybE [Aromatoleum petrolei]NMF87916.1 [NiFe]-hydrogenase assembly chaperone HybE [Aromatoleum petrolei]QTQ36716.1 [NiFe] hydrogenase assembly chaperone [Aromatoleum petrolei]